MTWDLNSPPVWAPNAIKTEKGWEDPDTGEVLVAIGNLDTKGPSSEAMVSAVSFDAESLAQGDPLSVTVNFNEAVDVVGGATLEVSSTGVGGNITLHAVAQSGVSAVVFSKEVDLTTDVTVPLETADLSIAAQSILGTITDSSDATPSDLSINGSIAAAAGIRSVA